MCCSLRFRHSVGRRMPIRVDAAGSINCETADTQGKIVGDHRRAVDEADLVERLRTGQHDLCTIHDQVMRTRTGRHGQLPSMRRLMHARSYCVRCRLRQHRGQQTYVQSDRQRHCVRQPTPAAGPKGYHLHAP